MLEVVGLLVRAPDPKPTTQGPELETPRLSTEIGMPIYK